MKYAACVLTTEYFALEEITDGVYAAIIKEGSGALGNAGIVNLGDSTLVFDTFLIPDAAHELKHAAEKLTKNKVKYVVNSHFHGDHIYGNQVFKDCTIISTDVTRELMKQNPILHDKEGTLASYDTYLKNQEERILQETNESKKAALRNDFLDKSKFAQALPNIELVLPTTTFTDRLEIHGSHRSVKVMTFGGGHTSSDAFLLLPEDRIAFMADLVSVKVHPWLGSGDPSEWLEILEKVNALDIQHLVPGHGPVGTKGNVEEVKDYISEIIRLVPILKRAGISFEEADIPKPFQDWNDPHVFEWNIRHFLQLD